MTGVGKQVEFLYEPVTVIGKRFAKMSLKEGRYGAFGKARDASGDPRKPSARKPAGQAFFIPDYADLVGETAFCAFLRGVFRK